MACRLGSVPRRRLLQALRLVLDPAAHRPEDQESLDDEGEQCEGEDAPFLKEDRGDASLRLSLVGLHHGVELRQERAGCLRLQRPDGRVVR